MKRHLYECIFRKAKILYSQTHPMIRLHYGQCVVKCFFKAPDVKPYFKLAIRHINFSAQRPIIVN